MSRYRENLKPYKVNFLLVTALFLIVSTLFAQQVRERRILEKRQMELARAKEGLSRIRAASLDHRSALTALKSQFKEDAVKATSASQIYSQLDEILKRHKPDDLVFGAIEKNGDSVALKYTLTFKDANYSTLLSTISQLQRNIFPFTPVESVTISQGENQGKGVVLSVVNGMIVSPEGGRP